MNISSDNRYIGL